MQIKSNRIFFLKIFLVAISKQMVNFGGTVPLDIGLEMESYGSGLNASTEDFREGMDALFKRKAKYQNK